MEYTVIIDGKPKGPYGLNQLKSLNITPETFIRKPGMDDYKEAHEFPELRELLGFRFQQTAPQYFAGFDQRLMACAIDYFFLLIGFAFCALIIFFVIGDKQKSLSMILSLLIFIPIVKIIYGSVVEASAAQATIGKKLMDIKVGDLYGNRLTIANSFGRNFAKFISDIPLLFGYLYLFLNKKQQCIHDVIANTVVVKKRLL